MAELEHYFNLILPWAVDESFILPFTGDSGALGALPGRGFMGALISEYY